MKTREEIILVLKEQYPIIKVGSEEYGYIELDAANYESTISHWADNYPPQPKTKEELELEATQSAMDKAALLAKLGITAEEATLLLG
jgi:hypothetical protein